LSVTKQSWPPWREAGAGPFLGRSPDERRQALIKLAWISVWMLYLGSPISDLLDRHHALPAAICGWAGLVVFVTGYLSVALFRTNQPRQPGRVLASPRPSPPFSP
jgi:two-component system sensor histidine kinase DesK